METSAESAKEKSKLGKGQALTAGAPGMGTNPQWGQALWGVTRVLSFRQWQVSRFASAGRSMVLGTEPEGQALNRGGRWGPTPGWAGIGPERCRRRENLLTDCADRRMKSEAAAIAALIQSGRGNGPMKPRQPVGLTCPAPRCQIRSRLQGFGEDEKHRLPWRPLLASWKGLFDASSPRLPDLRPAFRPGINFKL